MAVQMLLDGHSQPEVARVAGVSQSVDARMWRRYQEIGQFTRRLFLLSFSPLTFILLVFSCKFIAIVCFMIFQNDPSSFKYAYDPLIVLSSVLSCFISVKASLQV